MAHALGKQMGAMGRSVSCIFGQLLASAEIEEVGGTPVLGVGPGESRRLRRLWLMSDKVMRKKRLTSCTLRATF